MSFTRDFWRNPDALWDLLYILPAKRIISSIRGGWTTNFLLSYTHRRSGERFNKTLNGTKCQRNKSVITSEAFPRLGGKLFITQIYIMKALEFLIEKWYIKQRNQKKIHKERQRFVTKSCLFVIPKKQGWDQIGKILVWKTGCFPSFMVRVDQTFTWKKLA